MSLYESHSKKLMAYKIKTCRTKKLTPKIDQMPQLYKSGMAGGGGL